MAMFLYPLPSIVDLLPVFINKVVEDETELDAWEQQFRKLIQKVGPRAAASTKSLIQDISGRPVTDGLLF